MNTQMYFSIIITISTFIFLLIGCDGDVSNPTPNGSVRFVIKDTLTNEPLQFISIRLGPRHSLWSVSDEDGMAVIQGINPGNYTAEFYGSLYKNYSRNVVVSENGTDNIILFNKLDNSDSAAPSIIDTDIVGAHVWILFSERMRKKSVDSAIYIYLCKSKGAAANSGNCY